MIAGNAPEILSRLKGVRKTSAGWEARCPGHDDQTASLSVSIGDNGGVVLYCHANCKTADVVRAVGMRLADLMPHDIGDARANGKPLGRFVAVYDYRDEDGKLLYQVVRFDSKDFRQRAPRVEGGWVWKLNGVQRVLYLLPELTAADPAATVYIPEGEKDCDALAAMGLIATCNVGGAGKWRPEYSEALRGRHVVILPDNDRPGLDHAAMVANSLVSVAASVKVLELPDVPDKGDVSDWLGAGGAAGALEALAGEASEWTPTAAKRKATSRHKPQSVVSGDALYLRVPSSRTDSANARRLIQLYGDDLRWCEPWQKWLVWDGRRWAIDAERRAEALAKCVAVEIWKAMASLLPDLDPLTGRELTSFARYTASARGIANMLSLAKSEAGVPILPASLDSDRWLLNVQNGTVDMRTGQLRRHIRGDLITKTSNVKYDPAAECPAWLSMLDTIMGGSAELLTFLQRAVGYSLTASVAEQVLFLLWGTGSNGKSTFLNALMAAMGDDYAMQAPDGLLMVKHGDGHPTERADLFGKRLVASVEVEDGRRLSESMVKQLTGGDSIRARRMREDHWQFMPTHKLWLAANHKPVIRGSDHGIWRRIKLIPFVVTIPDSEQDKDLPAKLAAELAGILAWAIRGCLDWQRDGLGEPEAVREATNEYRAEMDVIGAFLADCCVEGARFVAKTSGVYSAYSRWCQENGEYAVNQRRFGAAMTERGFERYRSDGIWYSGLALITERTERTEQTF